jgi:predicted nucleic acid-binding protein
MVVVDTSFLLALLDSDEPAHSAVVEAFERIEGPFVVSPYVIAEADYLVLTRHGTTAEAALLDSLTDGSWNLPSFPVSDLSAALEVVRKYRDDRIGVTDASLVVLANRLGTTIIATLDRRHFGVLRNKAGKPFDILP